MTRDRKAEKCLQTPRFLLRQRGGRILAHLLVLGAASLPILPSPAHAARFTLLRLEDLSQFAGLSYFYSDSLSEAEGGGSDSSTNHNFSEYYTISSSYSILHPRLLKGSANVTLSFDQSLADSSRRGSDTASNVRLSYLLTGIILDRQPFPLEFSSAAGTSTVSAPFSRSYHLDTDSQSVALNVKNRFLPVTIELGRNASKTRGLENEIERYSRRASVTFRHRLADLSTTSLRLSQSRDVQTLAGTGTTDDQSNARAEFDNSLAWTSERNLRRQIGTRYLHDRRAGTYPGVQESFGTNLAWQLGKALNSTLLYSLVNNQVESRKNEQQTITGALSHQLFKSVATGVGGSYARGKYNDGKDTVTTGTASISYTKILPRESRLGLSYGYHYSVQDRVRTSITLTNVEQAAVAPPFPSLLDLAAQNIDPNSIQIFRDAGRTLPFTDFSVVFSGIRTRIQINSDPGVPVIYIAYDYRQSPNVTFASSGHAIGARLDMFDNRHAVHANYSRTDVKVLRGEDVTSTIGGSTHFDAGVDSALGNHTASLLYAYDNNVYQNNQRMEAHWAHKLKGRQAALLTTANERYSWYKSTLGKASNGEWDNNFILSTTYSRSLFREIKGKVKLGYQNLITSSTSSTSNLFDVSLRLEGTFGSTLVTLDSSASWGISPGSYSRNQTVLLQIQRYFR